MNAIQQLASLHHKLWQYAGGLATVVLIPFLHIGVVTAMIWVPEKTPVDRKSCSCSCWDTVFKGTYENHKSISYKHLYFNATPQVLKIWIVSMTFFIAIYEVTKYLWHLSINGKCRTVMKMLLLMDLYPHYYAWWNYFNYYNDDFYLQYYHQMFFTVTEIVCTALIISMCSKDADVDKRKVIIISSISFVHMLLGGMDQFFEQLVFRKGKLSQQLRNLGFVVPDFLHIVLLLLEYKNHLPASTKTSLVSTNDVCAFVGCSLLLFVVGKIVMK